MIAVVVGSSSIMRNILDLCLDMVSYYPMNKKKSYHYIRSTQPNPRQKDIRTITYKGHKKNIIKRIYYDNEEE